MAQTAVDRMDEYLGMKDGPERDFKQSLKDRRDESIGATESDLVDRLFKSVQDAFSPATLRKSADTVLDFARETEPNIPEEWHNWLKDKFGQGSESGRTISDQDLVISQSQLIRDEIEQGRYGLSKGRTFSDNDWWAVLQGADPAALLSEKGATISDRDRAIISGLLTGVRVPPIEEDTETTEVITESPEGAIALDETMQLPSAMELAQMGMGLGSRQTPPLQEGLGGFGFQPHQLPTPERLSPYEEMLMLASLGIPVAGLAGRAVGGLMRGMKGRPTLPQSPSAMRDMGPQAGNITGGAIALEKLGRPIPGRIKSSFDKILGEGAVPKKGLASLGRPIPPRSGPAYEKAIEKILKEYQKRK